MLWDCVPSKTFIASTGVRTELRRAPDLGFDFEFEDAKISLQRLNERVKRLATAQSADIADRLRKEGVTLINGRGEAFTHRIETDGHIGRLGLNYRL